MKKSFYFIASISWATLILYLTSIPGPQITNDELLSFLISGAQHFFFFGIQSILLYLSLPTKALSFVAEFWAISLTSLLGLVVELRQLNMPSRTADPLDLVLDTAGAVTFLFLFKKLQSKL